jgi:hypothetical protein
MQDVYTVKMFEVNGSTCLLFKDIKSSAHRNDYIAFVAVGVAPEEARLQQRAMAVLLLPLGNHPIFKQQRPPLLI